MALSDEDLAQVNLVVDNAVKAAIGKLARTAKAVTNTPRDLVYLKHDQRYYSADEDTFYMKVPGGTLQVVENPLLN